MVDKQISIGQLAARSGLPVSTLHFYERRGLIASERNKSNHRVYRRDVLRHVAIIKAAQSAGVPLAEIAEVLSHLPKGSTPSAGDWAHMAEGWREDLSRRIELLTSLRDRMSQCIGCGCLSLKRCPLFNHDDVLGEQGPGPHLL